METKLHKLMKNLGLTQEEAQQVIEDDKAIDKGAKLFELSWEQKQTVKQMKRADSKPQTRPREKKQDDERTFLMNLVRDALNDADCQNITIQANGREIHFEMNGRKFRFTLACPRNA